MPTIIDSLLVTLGLDSKSFDKQKAKVDQGIKDTGNLADASIQKVTKSAAKFLAFIGATYEVKKFIQEQIEASAALDRLSQNLNESVSSISAWSNAAEVAGGSAEGLQGTMDMLSRAQTELQLTGQSGLIPYLSALGISLADVNGHAKPVSTLLLDLSDRFGHMNRTTANNMGRMMGVDQGTMNLLLKGRAEVELYIKRQKEFNVVTEKQAEESSRLRASMVYTRQSFEAFGRAVLSDVTPALQAFFDGMKRISEWIQDNRSLVEGMAFAIGALVSPIVLVTGAIGALIDDFETWKNGGKSFFDWAPAVSIATTAVKGLKDVLEDALYRAGHLGAALMFLAEGDWADARAVAAGIISGKPAAGTGPANDRQRFIDSAAANLGVPSSAIDAQLRLETGPTGAKTIGSYNYGNIKAGKGYSGATVSQRVGEYHPYGATNEIAHFRSYSNPEEAAADYAAMIARQFPNAVGAQTATAFAQGLQAGGYATDPNYVAKVSTIASGIHGASSAAQGANNRVANAIMAPNSAVQTTIGQITIHTQATDADGIAKDLGKSLNYLFASQATYGLTP